MKPVMRHYAGDEDYPALRGFLADVLIANELREFSWHPSRLDWYRWHGVMNCGDPGMENVRLWEIDGKIVAFVLLEGPINAFVQIHPGFLKGGLYGKVLEVAESDLSGIGGDGKRKLYIWVDWKDKVAHAALRKRGYEKYDVWEATCRQGWQDPDRDIPAPKVPRGYSVRSQKRADIQSRSWCSWKSFHPNDPDEKYQGFQWYENVMKIPQYRPDLDMVTVGPSGDIVSFCTVWYDKKTNTAYFEPVGTHPDHQRKGLALACITEGLRRVKKLGCRRAFLAGHSEAAKATYAKAGFTEYDMLEPWVIFL